jgi:hypothetical protein
MKKAKKEKELPELLTKEHLAEMLHCSTKTVERMFADGLESFKIRNKRYVLRECYLEFINRHGASA